MRLRSIFALAASLVCACIARADWPRYDTNQDGVINFADLLNALESDDFTLVNEVLSHWGQDVEPPTPGATAKAIARWNVVPWQTFTGPFRVGVVAFHMNGIEKVSFRVNSGPWIEVREMTLNPSSGTPEYWIEIDPRDYPDGALSISALVSPTLGVPRVLQGEIDSTTLSTGEHSLLVFGNFRGTLPSVTRWVCSVTGDDTNNTGDATSPFRTIMRATRSIADASGGLADGGTVYLMPGEHRWGDYAYSLLTPAENRWLHVTSAPGARRQDVVINSVSDSGWQNGIRVRLQRLSNLTIKHPASISSAQPGAAVWIDRCEIVGPGPTSNGVYSDYRPIYEPKFSRGIYVTETRITDVFRPSRGWTYARGVSLERIGLDGFFNPQMLVNSSVRDLGVYPTSGHRDVIQFYQGRENTIIFGFHAVSGIVAQPLFSRGNRGNRSMNNTAIVNATFWLPADTTFHRSQWQQEGDHLLLWNSAFLSLPFLFRNDGDSQGELPTTIRNLSVRGTVFERLLRNGMDELLASGRFKSNHYIDATSYGAVAPGDDSTTGDPRLRSPASYDFRPAAGSPLVGRMSRVTPFDAANATRPDAASVGPFEP